ncbi:MAG TPA: sigma-70 family RNA polymerase sigma factor [Archangium sp.]|uniref:RNA polymerase sigma factor n=1 Tax=Archangium sp. TaxID=1872627 RepID=UPI002E35F5FF|nr:sigma-70 family RNA polymerase sigma factor [Archangium sp.]HEX5747432.1 sigma-70 family RNA polymerase sigma factor [Archangium sp.]
MSSMRMDHARADIEARVQALCRAGEVSEAATLTIRAHGPEVLGFLCTALGDRADAEEVFSVFCEALWRGLASFQWRCSLRTWTYVIARHACLRFGTRASRQPLRASEPLNSEVLNVAAEVRQSTVSHLRGDPQERVRELRALLSTEEQMLLTLRIDRRMEWVDIARVLLPEAEEPERAAAAVRKRFQRLKERLRARMTPAPPPRE